MSFIFAGHQKNIILLFLHTSREYPPAFMLFLRLTREAQRMCSFYYFLNQIFRPQS